MQVTAESLPANPLGAALEWVARKPWRAFLIIFTLSFSIQSFFLTKVDERYVRPNTRREMPAIAVSLAERGEFADPYALPTGPTAHLPPISPAIFALSYRLFGLTPTAGYIAWLLTFAIYAAVWGMLPWLAGRVGLGGPAGVLAGFVGALIPRWSGHGEGLAALAIGLLLVAFVQRWMSGRSTTLGSLLLGIGAGIAFHVQPAILPVVLGWMGFELWWSKDRRKWLFSALITLGMILACLPWGWRNYKVFDAVFFIRSNFGLELRMGNHPGVAAAMDVMDRRPDNIYIHPRALESEARKVQQLGEVAYMRQAGREALDWIAEHPAEFIGLTASRAAYWWFGPLYYPPGAFLVTLLTILAALGAWLTFPTLAPPQRAGLVIPLLTFPLVYYVVAYMPRYREPLDWIFLLLAGAAVWRWMGTRRI
jgi:4-amino-4-deoxy-L-arabinose transferase-like glycosyltransferase